MESARYIDHCKAKFSQSVLTAIRWVAWLVRVGGLLLFLPWCFLSLLQTFLTLGSSFLVGIFSDRIPFFAKCNDYLEKACLCIADCVLTICYFYFGGLLCGFLALFLNLFPLAIRHSILVADSLVADSLMRIRS